MLVYIPVLSIKHYPSEYAMAWPEISLNTQYTNGVSVDVPVLPIKHYPSEHAMAWLTKD